MDVQFFNVRIRQYAPMVFHHLRKIDGVDIRPLIDSLNPNKNLKIIQESFASGGRSSNPIIFTHDKKYLLKTVSKEEKNIFVKMLPEFHRRMRDCKSFLCRIYGIFRISVSHKQNVHLILMRNMNELPSDTRIAVFDLKGSTVDRSVLDSYDQELIKNGKANDVIEKYRKRILKDIDFVTLGFKLNLSPQDANMVQPYLSSDSEFLRGFNLMDYSLLLSVHKYNKHDEESCSQSQRHRVIKSKNYEYLYNISVIDFLTEYDFSKMLELRLKTAGTLISDNKDTNFSVKDACYYSRRFIRFINNQLQED